jgi:protein-serine/threonine kinase
MTQLFTSHPSVASEKRNFHGISLPSKKHGTSNDSSNTHLPSRIKNFFRINSSGSGGSHSRNQSGERDREKDSTSTTAARHDSKPNNRQSRFLPVIGRNRSTTVASEGNPLDEGLSPTAHANPYFAHQGHPALRHRNEGSLPSSPPDTPELQVQGISAADQATTAGKEELARKLRRVASAPNAQGLFANDKAGDRPKTAELGKEPLVEHGGHLVKVGLIDAAEQERGRTLPLPTISPHGKIPSPGQIRTSSVAAFRRTYSSNSIKVRNVEVGPGSFDKIKLIGKGDVGKVYLVREKKSSRLYAMKGWWSSGPRCGRQLANPWSSLEQEGDD